MACTLAHGDSAKERVCYSFTGVNLSSWHHKYAQSHLHERFLLLAVLLKLALSAPSSIPSPPALAVGFWGRLERLSSILQVFLFEQHMSELSVSV